MGLHEATNHHLAQISNSFKILTLFGALSLLLTACSFVITLAINFFWAQPIVLRRNLWHLKNEIISNWFFTFFTTATHIFQYFPYFPIFSIFSNIFQYFPVFSNIFQYFLQQRPMFSNILIQPLYYQFTHANACITSNKHSPTHSWMFFSSFCL